MSRVLVVEDEKHLAEGLRFNLEAEGYEVEVVETGESALDLLLEKSRTFDVVVLDVRRQLEWAEAHIKGAVHIPLHELPGRLDHVPPGEVWVHCHSGYRSTVAASLLAARGRQVVGVDDDFGNAAAAGLPIELG